MFRELVSLGFLNVHRVGYSVRFLLFLFLANSFFLLFLFVEIMTRIVQSLAQWLDVMQCQKKRRRWLNAKTETFR